MSENFTTTKPEGWEQPTGKPAGFKERVRTALDEGLAPNRPQVVDPSEVPPMKAPSGQAARLVAGGLFALGLLYLVFSLEPQRIVAFVILAGLGGLALVIAELRDRRGDAIRLERRKQLGIQI